MRIFAVSRSSFQLDRWLIGRDLQGDTRDTLNLEYALEEIGLLFERLTRYARSIISWFL